MVRGSRAFGRKSNIDQHAPHLVLPFREDGAEPVTLVFDLAGCGLKNMDMEFIQYLIGIFRDYCPYSLNYILVFEMPWVLNGNLIIRPPVYRGRIH
jgi:hypothetical protein